jgi:hypothetical protein
MSWFWQHIDDKSSKAAGKTVKNPSSEDDQDLAIFGLLPLRPESPCHSLFAREVQVEESPEREEWEAIHLDLM